MNEKEFARRYAAAQEQVTASDDLKKRTLAAAEAEGGTTRQKGSKQPTPEAAAGVIAGQQAHPENPAAAAPTVRARRGWQRPAVAGVAAALLAAACAPLVLGGLSGTSPAEPAGSTAGNGPASIAAGTDPSQASAADSLFSVQAYAASLDSFIPSDDGLIRFPIDSSLGFSSQSANDWYPGFVFSIEGDGIERIQATLSDGELCSYAFEELTMADDREKLAELAGWKPYARGMGTYYRDYDWVGGVRPADDGAKDDPERVFLTRLIKRLGSTVDMPVSPDEPLMLGMWFDASDYPTDASGRIDTAALDGQTLTITAQYADGACQTQVIDLHKGTFLGDWSNFDPRSACDIVPIGAPLSEEEALACSSPVTTVYGTVASVTNEPHPYALDRANEHADAVVPVDQSELEANLERSPYVTCEGVPAGRQLAEDGRLSATVLSLDEHGSGPSESVVTLDSISGETSRELPAEMDFATDTELSSYLGQFDQMNYVLQARDGFTVSEEGTLDDAHVYQIVRMTATNESSRPVEFLTAELGVPGIVDENGQQTRFAVECFGAATDGESAFGDGGMSLKLQPGESRHVTLAYVLPRELAESGEAVFAGGVVADPSGNSLISPTSTPAETQSAADLAEGSVVRL
ncbi:hypothetical protein [Xiamenia xianingshaonis]|uniref:Uncharacterized protein n=1 Tax=Xiamenia xianingshaonis TaxID=2682776 RepID=A0A9E6MQH2_9ACTN|nr:hypothetical protein [Xiamenia xianingshaonis]NHM14682.1 hypothetical protein [Xiamenia xianingshaonis]QTU84285.1 hypothetical protein J7S26_08065 [Xiamenia xianingshaonis]